MSVGRTLAIFLLGAWAGATQAGDPGDFRFSGFATLGGVVLDDRAVSFVRGSGLNKPGGGFLDLGPDSVVGLQLNADLGARTDFTIQIRADENDEGHFTPRLGWAFLRQVWTPELITRVGRLRAPFFMLSDSLQINYANPWVRPAPEVYGLNPFNDLDGADLLYRVDLGGAELEVRPYFGSGSVSFAGGGQSSLKSAKGVNLALYRGPLSLHAGHGEGRFDIHWGDPDTKSLTAALRGFGFGSVADQISGGKGYARFDSVGAQWDDGTWLISGEYVRRRVNRYISSNHAWFLSLGYRVGNFVPYVTTARQVADQLPADTELPIPLLDLGLKAFQVSRNPAQHSVALGVRWDVAPGLALKSEYAHAGIERNAWGSFFPADTGAPFDVGGKSIHMLSLSMDWVF